MLHTKMFNKVFIILLLYLIRIIKSGKAEKVE